MKFGIFSSIGMPPFSNSFAATWSDFVPAPDGRVIPASADALSNSSKKLARLMIEAAATAK